MLTKNQKLMLGAQFRDYINSDSDEDVEPINEQDNRQKVVTYDENEDISRFDANLITGVLERKPFGDMGITSQSEMDPLMLLIAKEYE